MAVVYLARDDELDRPVAVKLLAGHLADDPVFRDRFVREARLAAQLSHPNIVQIYDAGEDDGNPYIVMEYVDGRSLADLLELEGPLGPERVVDLGAQVCAGLEHAHAAGLVHRDVKPGNLLLGEGAVVKIADFGVARAAETTRLTQMGSVLGTAAYLSPEQALGEEVTAAADIYSFGCVLYECLTGRTPYTFETLAELAIKHKQEPITPVRELRPEIPEGLEAVVMRCLARNPDYRPPSAAVLGQELAGADEVTRPLPRGSGARMAEVRTEPLRRPVRRDRKALAFRGLVIGVLALLLVLAAIIVAVVGLSDGNGDGSSGRNPTPSQVEPVQQTGDPSTDAQNLADWLRANSG